jgi:hypothetical protein
MLAALQQTVTVHAGSAQPVAKMVPAQPVSGLGNV